MIKSTALINSLEGRDPHSLALIRQKFQIVFGTPSSLGDEILRKRYRISADGDLIVVIA